jgi:hypothetical protein
MTENRATAPHPATPQILVQLLSIHSPELGARLKQRLNAAFIANGLGYFDEKSLGYGKFTDYLSREHSALVHLERKEGVGDILVSLRAESKRVSFPDPSNPPKTERPKVIRNDVWQAFANPDSERKRFLNRNTGKIVHFIASKHSLERAEVESSPELFLEISPVAPESQLEWMGEFLSGMSLPADEKAVLQELIRKPYSSAVNVTFTRALGANSRAWRNFRTERVTKVVHQWVSEKMVPLDKILAQPTESPITPIDLPCVDAASKLSQPAHATAPPSEQFPPRQQVAKLLELLSDEDIIRLVIPTLLSTILIKSRM